VEKQGVDRRCSRFRSRLLSFWFCVLFTVFPPPSIAAAPDDPGAESGPEILVECVPEHPILNHIWTLAILTDHPRLAEVEINPPAFSDSLVLTQTRTAGRRASSDGKRWTAVEFLFIPLRAGSLTLGPFEVLIPGHRIMTAELTVLVREDRESSREYYPQLFWEPYSSRLRIGEMGELALRIRDWDPAKSLPLPRFQAVAPMEALLENLPLTENDRNLERVLRLKIVPLAEGLLTLGPFVLQFDSLSLAAPVVELALLPALATRTEAPLPSLETLAIPAQVAETAGSAGRPKPSFPVVLPEGPALIHRTAEAAVEQARLFWEEGRYAEALGVLRSGERDLMGGYGLSPLRRAAEEALEIRLSIDEKWRPRNFLLGLSLGGLGLFTVIVLFTNFRRSRRKNGVTSRSGQGYKSNSISLVVLAALLVIFIRAFAGYTNPDFRVRQDRAILRSCTVYRVPDLQGAVSALWKEGQPVLVHSLKSGWVYVEVPGGEAGWVRRDNVVFY
jgi:hypothetical protein